MHLATNWRDVLRHAWSIRLILLAALLAAVEGVVHLAGGLMLPDWLQMALTVLAPIVSLAAFLARIVAQKELS